MATILCVSPDLNVRAALAQAVERAGHRAVTASTMAEGREELGVVAADLVLTDAVTTIRADGEDWIAKPLDTAQLAFSIERALDIARLRRENAILRNELATFRSHAQIVGQSEAIRRATRELAMAATTRAAVLLLGDRGTGKELFANTLHAASDRRDGPFVQLDCAALPIARIESAMAEAIDRAHRGTLFLKNLVMLPPPAQAALTNAISDALWAETDIRLVAAAGHDVVAAVESGRFKQELYLTLSVVPIRLPALSERANDVPLLANHFGAQLADAHRKPFEGMAHDALEWLAAQPWPGNVRELRNAVERAILNAREALIPLHRFPGAPRIRPATPAVAAPAPTLRKGAVVLHTLNVDEAERALIEAALQRTGGNRTRAAALLGMSLRSLRMKLNETPRGGSAAVQPE